jgi:hypothetical protein
MPRQTIAVKIPLGLAGAVVLRILGLAHLVVRAYM